MAWGPPGADGDWGQLETDPLAGTGCLGRQFLWAATPARFCWLYVRVCLYRLEAAGGDRVLLVSHLKEELVEERCRTL